MTQPITCPQCKCRIMHPQTVRCPRCNAVLVTPCTGSCSNCQQKQDCKETK